MQENYLRRETGEAEYILGIGLGVCVTVLEREEREDTQALTWRGHKLYILYHDTNAHNKITHWSHVKKIKVIKTQLLNLIEPKIQS